MLLLITPLSSLCTIIMTASELNFFRPSVRDRFTVHPLHSRVVIQSTSYLLRRTPPPVREPKNVMTESLGSSVVLIWQSIISRSDLKPSRYSPFSSCSGMVPGRGRTLRTLSSFQTVTSHLLIPSWNCVPGVTLPR